MATCASLKTPGFSWIWLAKSSRVDRSLVSYQVQTGSTTEILHHNPQLMTSQKTGLVLRYERASACGQNGDFLLDFLDVVLTGFEIDL